MTSDWDDFYSELRREAAEAGAGPDLEAWEQHFRNQLSLIQMREAAGLSQRQLAARARVPQGDISRIEQGKGNPTLRTLLRMVAACGARLRIELPNGTPEGEMAPAIHRRAAPRGVASTPGPTHRAPVRAPAHRATSRGSAPSKSKKPPLARV
jgi:transcriptional regulator with XRE-family HTH domain